MGLFTGAFHSDTEPLNFLLQPWRARNGPSKPRSSLPGIPLPPAAACLSQLLGKSKPARQFALAAAPLQRQGQSLTCHSKVVLQSLAPEQQEPSLLQDLEMRPTHMVQEVLPEPVGVCHRSRGKGSSWSVLGGNPQRELVKSHFLSIPQPCSTFQCPFARLTAPA